MDFESLSYDDLDQHMIFEEGSLSPIIRGHLFIKKVLRISVSRNMQNADTFFKSSRPFSLVNDIAFGMALINVQVTEIGERPKHSRVYDIKKSALRFYGGRTIKDVRSIFL